MERLLITGAAGGLGRVARKKLQHFANKLRLSDISQMEPSGPHEECVVCDLSDEDAVMKLVDGCDGVLHLGGVSSENTFANIRAANLDGVYNLYEAARRHGSPRIFFASSNHTIGFYRQDEKIDHTSPVRPDGLYGVSKCFGEALARLYYEKFGQESALVRIGSCYPKPKDARMLSTWLSYDDFASLAERVFTTEQLGCPVIWGISNNNTAWWSNDHVAYLGWHPKDNGADYANDFEGEETLDPTDSQAIYQGGRFVDDPIFSGD